MADNILILNNITPEELARIKELNRNSLIKQKDKSDDDFEKMHIVIATGALALSIGFAEKLAPLDKALYKWILIVGWGLLIVSLVLNFLSHLLASQFSENQIELLDANQGVKEINSVIDANNRMLRRINWWSSGVMIAGIAGIVVYCSINTLKMPSNTSEPSTKIGGPSSDDLKKGRTSAPLVHPPTRNVPEQNPKPTTQKPK